MKRTRQEKRVGRPHGRIGSGASMDVAVKRLGRRFEIFRRSHEPGTRIPGELRAAALATLERGASTGDVLRACRITSVQLRLWRQQLRRGTQVGGVGKPVAQVFDVVDEAEERAAGLGSEPLGPELELRLGSWAVRISQIKGQG
jgi:transposase-like protein